jgi:hypothetical protein
VVSAKIYLSLKKSENKKARISKKRKGDGMQGKNDKKDKLQQNPQVVV